MFRDLRSSLCPVVVVTYFILCLGSPQTSSHGSCLGPHVGKGRRYVLGYVPNLLVASQSQPRALLGNRGNPLGGRVPPCCWTGLRRIRWPSGIHPFQALPTAQMSGSQSRSRRKRARGQDKPVSPVAAAWYVYVRPLWDVYERYDTHGDTDTCVPSHYLTCPGGTMGVL